MSCDFQGPRRQDRRGRQGTGDGDAEDQRLQSREDAVAVSGNRRESPDDVGRGRGDALQAGRQRHPVAEIAGPLVQDERADEEGAARDRPGREGERAAQGQEEEGDGRRQKAVCQVKISRRITSITLSNLNFYRQLIIHVFHIYPSSIVLQSVAETELFRHGTAVDDVAGRPPSRHVPPEDRSLGVRGTAGIGVLAEPEAAHEDAQDSVQQDGHPEVGPGDKEV